MNWKLKARLQRAISLLPSTLSYNAYYFIQRRFGNLRETSPVTRLKAGIGAARRLREHGRPVEGKTFLEVGTGHALNLPLALWLCGAAEVVTVDLNPYLSAELVMEDLGYIRDHDAGIREIFEDYTTQGTFEERLTFLRRWTNPDMTQLLQAVNIRYLAPADAAYLALEDLSIDYHVSYTVFEHIPREVLLAILQEAKRVLKKEGLLVHLIDYSDHFSHSDSSISTVNFLQFSDSQWRRLAGNRYMYHNRMRADDFAELFAEAGIEILSNEPCVDPRALSDIQNGLRLDPRFRGKPDEINATRNAWVVASPQG